MGAQQEVIDKLIDYIDKAILKNSVSNRHVAAVLAFLNEELKNKNVDIDSLRQFFLSKDQSDRTEHDLSVGGDLTAEGLLKALSGLNIGGFISGVPGSGAHIDEHGFAEMTGLKLEGFLEAPEYRFNKVDVVSGELWNAVDFGTIESVDLAKKIITLKLVDGEKRGAHTHDFCKGMFHNISGNATSVEVDTCGFNKVPGFATAYFTPTEIIDNTSFKYELKTGTSVHPCAGMKYVVYGNEVEESRQFSAYNTRNYKRYLKNVDSWEITEDNIAMQFGDCTGLTIGGEDMSGYSAYLNNVYITGTIKWLEDNIEKFKGKDGVGLDGIKEYYLATTENSGITVETDGWQEIVQTTDRIKKFLWNYEVLTYTDGNITINSPAIIGTYGDDGRGISKITEYYLASAASSNVTTQDTGWTTTPQKITATKKYLWNYEVVTYSDGTLEASEPLVIGVYGDTGPQGIPGEKGDTGLAQYTWIRYADDANGGGISNNPSGKKYIGFAYNKTTATESSSPSEYTWSLIKGDKGDTGVQGAPGTDGQTTYTWIKYAPSADGSNMTDAPTSTTEYIGIAINKDTTAESTFPSDYVWSKFKGDSAYVVELSSNFAIVNVNSKGEIDGDIYSLENIVSGANLVHSGGSQIIQKKYSIYTEAQVYKEESSLSYTDSNPVEGQYSLSIVGEGCTWVQTDGRVTIQSISEDLAIIKITVNCEGKVSVLKTFQVKRVYDGVDASLLPWVEEWDNNKTLINGEYVVSPKTFSGTKDADGKLTGIAMGRDCIDIDGLKRTGIFALVDDEVVFELDPITKKYKFTGEINATSGVFSGSIATPPVIFSGVYDTLPGDGIIYPDTSSYKWYFDIGLYGFNVQFEYLQPLSDADTLLFKLPSNLKYEGVECNLISTDSRNNIYFNGLLVTDESKASGLDMKNIKMEFMKIYKLKCIVFTPPSNYQFQTTDGKAVEWVLINS